MQILPYQELPAAFAPWDARTPLVAREVACWIEGQIGDVRLEHIGSTAVPELPGKGIIDFMLLYGDGALGRVRAALDALGFQRQSTRDPFPESRPMRIGAIRFDGSIFRLHVHVLAVDAVEVTGLRRFRDALITDPALRKSYIALKQEIIASGVRDSVAYCYLKEAFFRSWMPNSG